MAHLLTRAFAALTAIWLAAPALAQTPSFSRTDYSSSAGPRGIAAADFNRDGAVDLALANNGRKSVTILLNFTARGQGFTRAYEIDLGGGPFDITTGDVNHDNVVDVVIANADGNSIDVLRGLAAGGFAEPIRVGAMGNPRGVALHDMDRDGKLDIVYTQFHFQSVQILHGDGSGWNFVARKGAATTGQQPQGVVAADFNLDGLPDLAVANTSASPLAILYQTAVGTFRLVEVPGPQYLNVLTAADLDGDGWVDIAAASSAHSQVPVFRNGPSGFALTAQLASGASPRGIGVADVNRDGMLDIVTANRGSSTVSIFTGRRGTSALFNAAVTVAAGSGSRDVALADFNGDVQVDVATANEFGNSATVLLNGSPAPQTLFWEAQKLPSTQGSGWLALADFNKNGRIDVVHIGGVTLDGEREVALVSPTAEFQFASNAATGDFNGDGNVDLVLVANYGEPRNVILDLYYGDGAGAFRFVSGFDLASWGVYGIRAGDVTSDGRLDLIVFDRGQHVRVLAGSDGRFVAHSTVTLQSFGLQFDVADMNRDGRLDVVAVQTHHPSNGVQVLHGDGAGNFSSAHFLPSSWERSSIRTSDVNNDGLLDIVTGGSRIVTVWLTRTDGAYHPPIDSAEPAYAEHIVVGDFTGDGRKDLLSRYGQLLRGRGDGTFADPERLNLDWAAGEAVDYDKDGRLDVVIARAWHIIALMTRAVRGPNLTPLAHAGTSSTIRYESQFEDEIYIGSDGSFDPNLDQIAYEWRDASGKILGTEQSLGVPLLDPGTYAYTLIVRDPFGAESSATTILTIAPFKEPGGFHTRFAARNPVGAWRPVADATAAQQERLWHPDAGAPKVTSASAAPANYVDVAVVADPTQQYKLWMRLLAQNNHWANDSVFVQFQHGVITADGQTRYRVGTTEALEINLEQCSGCGISGWGWRDERWGAALNSPPKLLRFPKGGFQFIRVQTREDGVSFDQIVLSAEKYRDAPPGPAKNDNTVVPPWW